MKGLLQQSAGIASAEVSEDRKGVSMGLEEVVAELDELDEEELAQLEAALRVRRQRRCQSVQKDQHPSLASILDGPLWACCLRHLAEPFRTRSPRSLVKKVSKK